MNLQTNIQTVLNGLQTKLQTKFDATYKKRKSKATIIDASEINKENAKQKKEKKHSLSISSKVKNKLKRYTALFGKFLIPTEKMKRIRNLNLNYNELEEIEKVKKKLYFKHLKKYTIISTNRKKIIKSPQKAIPTTANKINKTKKKFKKYIKTYIKNKNKFNNNIIKTIKLNKSKKNRKKAQINKDKKGAIQESFLNYE